MKRVLEYGKKVLRNKIFIIVGLLLVVLLIILLWSRNTETVDEAYIIGKLEKSSELTTIKLNYTGMSEFKDSGIILINRSDFIMVYEAEARVGIDVSEVLVEVDDLTRVVSLKIPEAKILDVKVDSSKIKYFDEKFALFNIDSKEDANKAIVLAEKGAKDELINMGILEMADNQAEALIRGLIQDIIPRNYSIKVK